MNANNKGIPSIEWSGTKDGKNMMILELLGNNLEQQKVIWNQRFTLKTTLMIVDQLLDRICTLHKAGYLHRNLKPENLMVGIGEHKNLLYLIDFGLAKKYMRDGKIIPFKKGRIMTGALRYASINSMLGFEQSRRDDLESIGYLMVYFLKGELPWQNIPAKDKDDKFKAVL